MNAVQLIEDWRLKGRDLHVEGADTVLWRMGEGETVLCLHGVPASGFLYRKLLPELAARGLEGMTLDLPGLGLADRPATFDYTWSGLAAWCLNAIDAAGVGEFHMVVHDIGGPIGFDIISRIPGRIRSLTVLNTIVDVSTFQRPWVMEPFAWPAIGRLWLQTTQTPVFYGLLRMLGMYEISRTEAQAYARLLVAQDGGRAFLRIMRSFERTPAFEQRIKAALKARTFPAQIIWGKDDPALRAKTYAPHLQSALNLQGYEEVRGKHFLQEDSAPEIAALIVRFIGATDGRRLDEHPELRN